MPEGIRVVPSLRADTALAPDAVLLQKYLLTTEKTLPDRNAGDLDENGRLDAADLTLLKRLPVVS